MVSAVWGGGGGGGGGRGGDKKATTTEQTGKLFFQLLYLARRHINHSVMYIKGSTLWSFCKTTRTKYKVTFGYRIFMLVPS